MHMAPQQVLELAKQGDPDAIASILNRALGARGVKARVSVERDILQVELESDPLPDRQKLVPPLEKAFVGLAPRSLRGVTFYGLLTGSGVPTWVRSIEFASTAVEDSEVSQSVYSTAKFLEEYSAGERVFCNVNLAEADLIEANLCEVVLTAANLQESGLCAANLSAADLKGANLVEANLSEANLDNANLSEANLSGAVLEYASLRQANLRGTTLVEADLSQASLSDANLAGTNLQGALLQGVNLMGANLVGANLHETQLHGACYNKQTDFDEGFVPELVGMVSLDSPEE